MFFGFSSFSVRCHSAAPRWPKCGSCWAHLGPTWPQDGAKTAPRWPQRAPRWAQEGAKKAPNGAVLIEATPFFCHLASKSPQDCPKSAPGSPQEGPKGPQEGPRKAPSGPQEGPNWVPRGFSNITRDCIRRLTTYREGRAIVCSRIQISTTSWNKNGFPLTSQACP